MGCGCLRPFSGAGCSEGVSQPFHRWLPDRGRPCSLKENSRLPPTQPQAAVGISAVRHPQTPSTLSCRGLRHSLTCHGSSSVLCSEQTSCVHGTAPVTCLLTSLRDEMKSPPASQKAHWIFLSTGEVLKEDRVDCMRYSASMSNA